MIIAIDDVVMMEKSNSLTAIANNINTLSNDINAEITKLQEAWRSEASDLLCQRFTLFIDRNTVDDLILAIFKVVLIAKSH